MKRRYLWNEIEIHTCALRLPFFRFFIKKNLSVTMKHVKLSFFYSFSKNKFPSKSIQKSVAFRRKKILERTLSLYPSSKSTSTNKKKKLQKRISSDIESLTNLPLFLLSLLLLLLSSVHSFEAKKLRTGLERIVSSITN